MDVHKGAFCQFPFRWNNYCHSSKSTGKETGITHLCAVYCSRLYGSYNFQQQDVGYLHPKNNYDHTKVANFVKSETQINWTFPGGNVNTYIAVHVCNSFTRNNMLQTFTVIYYMFPPPYSGLEMFNWFEFQNFSTQIYKIGNLKLTVLQFFFSFLGQSLPSTKATTPSNSWWRRSSGSNSSRWYKIAIPNRICSLQWRWRGVHFIRSYWCHKCYYRYSGFNWHRSFDCSEAQIHAGNKFDNMV